MYLYILCVLLCSIETIIVSLCANKDIIIIIIIIIIKLCHAEDELEPRELNNLKHRLDMEHLYILYASRLSEYFPIRKHIYNTTITCLIILSYM